MTNLQSARESLPTYSVNELNKSVGLLLSRGFSPKFILKATVSKSQLKKDEDKVYKANQEGARLLCGGSRPSQFKNGYFYSPTVFDKVVSRMEMMNFETFGPIIPIQRIKSLEDQL